MACEFDRPRIDPRWADSRETHLAIATAIHAIASVDRTPEAIWENPTRVEWQLVEMAVEQYLGYGYFEREIDGRYEWGQWAIHVDPLQMPLPTFPANYRVE